MVSGALVYSLLKQEHPRALEHWTAVLKQHPQLEERWRERLDQEAAADRDQYLWMLAARWPDDIRGNPDYDRPEWHYINLPYKPEGQPESVVLPSLAEVNILTAYRTNLAVLKGEAAPREKAVALCWLLHLVGDIHQPLHAATLFTTEFPEGDRGGTRFYIRATAESDSIGLHKFWDDLILGAEEFRAARNAAILVRQAHPPGELTELAARPDDADFRVWAEEESFSLARRSVYLQGRLKGSAARDGGPVLPDGYAASAQQIARRRMALAGHRLTILISGLPKSGE
jgi:hypothetical protein